MGTVQIHKFDSDPIKHMPEEDIHLQVVLSNPICILQIAYSCKYIEGRGSCESGVGAFPIFSGESVGDIMHRFWFDTDEVNSRFKSFAEFMLGEERKHEIPKLFLDDTEISPYVVCEPEIWTRIKELQGEATQPRLA